MNKTYQVVIDTNVFISSLRSRRGASFLLMSLLGKSNFEINLSVPLVLEYEQVARRSRWMGKPHWGYISDIIDYMCLVGHKRKIYFLWRPREKDLKDDMILEVAVAADCNCIITYNKKDFPDAKSFGIDLFTPLEFLEITGELK